jgi:hypothetical protein
MCLQQLLKQKQRREDIGHNSLKFASKKATTEVFSGH